MGLQGPKLILERDGLRITHHVLDGADNLVRSVAHNHEFSADVVRAVSEVPGVDHAFRSWLNNEMRIFYGIKRGSDEETVAAAVIDVIVRA